MKKLELRKEIERKRQATFRLEHALKVINNGWEPNSKIDVDGWRTVRYDYKQNKMIIGHSSEVQASSCWAFKNSEVAAIFINQNMKDLKIYFRIEEK